MERREVPYSLEAEQSVLGSAFLSKDALTKICDDLNEDDFYLDSHKIIYSVLKDLHDEGIPVDITIVTDRLESSGELTKVGNIDYLVEIANFVPSAANVEYYINIVHDKSVLRKLIEVSNEIFAVTQEIYQCCEEKGIAAVCFILFPKPNLASNAWLVILLS